MATAYQGNKPYIFLSYSHKDEELALSVIEYLQEKNFNVWYDEGIHSGTQWKDVILEKIANPNCWMMVFLVTQNSLASKECRREIIFADKKEKKFLNVVSGSPNLPDWFICDFDENQRLDEEKFPNRKAMLDKLNSELIWHQMNPDKSNDTPKDSPKDTQKEFPEGSPLPTAKAPEVAKVPKASVPTQKSSEPSVAPKASPAPSRTKGLRFTFKGNTAKVSGYTGTDSKVIIPVTITRTGKTYNVTSIIAFAFAHCENLISVTIPNSVISIGDYAFNYCSNLTIYCEAKSKPEGWHTDWNPDNRPVVWGHGSSRPEGDEGSESSQPSIDPKASKEPLPSKGLKFTITNGTARVDRYKGTDTKVIIPATITRKRKFYKVTSIGENAFKYCKKLSSISIPDSVTSIGTSAFEGCSSLTSIAIPESVTFIEGLAFMNCENLTSISIPNNVKHIGIAAFKNCKKLSSISIPDSVTSIGRYAFEDCTRLTSITIPDSVTTIGAGAFKNCENLTSISIPNNVKHIGIAAFKNCKNLTSISIPNSVSYISNFTFAGCTNLTSITIPNSVTSIEIEAFYGCKNLTSVTIPDSVTSIIGYDVFEGCESLTSIEVDENNQNYKSIDGNLYTKEGNTLIQYAAGKTATSFTIPDNVTSIDGHAFYGCKNLTSITIPDNVTSIGYHAFHSCTNLTSIEVDENNQNFKSIDGNLYTKEGTTLIQYAIGKTATSFTIPDDVTSIGGHAFHSCTNLTSVYIPNSVTSIGDYAFNTCKNLTSIIIPDSVTTIGEMAFSSCENLTIYCEAKSKPEGWHAKWNPHNRPVVWNCGSSRPEGDEGSLSVDPKASQEPLPAKGLKFTIVDGTARVDRYKGTDTKVIIPATIIRDGKTYKVTSIENFAFNGRKKLISITIPTNVTTIGDWAFSGCKNLISITIPNSVTTIGRYAFAWCENLTSITIPNSVTSIGESAFSWCTNLTSITIPDSVTTIGDVAFWGCKNLTSITIPDGVTTIGANAFWGCKNLTSITIPDGVTSIGESAFEWCDKLTIYCEAKSMPEGWQTSWNPHNRPVVWGHKMN